MGWMIGEEVAFASPERPEDYWHRITWSGAAIRDTQDHPRGAFVRAMMEEQRQMQQQLHQEMRLQEAAAMGDMLRERQYQQQLEIERQREYRRRHFHRDDLRQMFPRYFEDLERERGQE